MTYKVIVGERGDEARSALVDIDTLALDCKHHPECSENPAAWYIGRGFTTAETGDVEITGSISLLGPIMVEP